MKKHLLSTSAIALGVAMAAPASAQNWDMKWGGYYNTHVGVSSVDRNFASTVDNDGVNIFTNGELWFLPSVTLDNGLTFGVNIQLEALNTGGARVDESFMEISSDTLGKIILGNENSAGYKSMVAAPQVGSMPVNSRSTSAFVPVTASGGFRQAALSSYTEVGGNNDVQRITYFTPSFNGLTVGVSYAPSSAVNAGNNAPVDFNSAANITDIFDIGVNYGQSFNGVDVSFGARYGTASSNVVGVSDPETWGVGFQVGVSGFTFGAAYAENDNGAAGGVGDQDGVSVGIAYDLAGPWTIGLEGYSGNVTTAVSDSEYDAIKLGASRKLGNGVSWDVYYYNQETKNGVNGNNIKGDVIATAINLKF